MVKTTLGIYLIFYRLILVESLIIFVRLTIKLITGIFPLQKKNNSYHDGSSDFFDFFFFFGKDPYRTLMPLRGSFCCFSLAIVAVDINVENLKRNGTLLSQFAQNIVEARFLRNINRMRVFTRNLNLNKVSRNLTMLFYDCLPIKDIYRPKNKILFWSVRQDHGRFEVNLFLICFIKRAKLQDLFINALTLPK